MAKRKSRDSRTKRGGQPGRGRALKTLGLMRSKHLSLARAAKEAGTTPRTVKRYVGSALWKTEIGRYRAEPSDRLVRSLEFLTPEGRTVLQVRGSRNASLVGEYFDALKRYLTSGRTDALRKFEGKSLRVGKITYRFITDLELIDRLGNAGEIQFEDIYAMGG